MISSRKYVLEPTTPLGNHTKRAKDDRYSAPHFNRITSANHEFALLFWKTINHEPPAYLSKEERRGQGEQCGSDFQVSSGLRRQDWSFIRPAPHQRLFLPSSEVQRISRKRPYIVPLMPLEVKIAPRKFALSSRLLYSDMHNSGWW